MCMPSAAEVPGAGRRTGPAREHAEAPGGDVDHGGMDNAAHIGGFVVGFGLGKIFVDRQPMNSREKQKAYALGWLAGLVVVASFVMMLLHFTDRLPWQQP